MSNKYIIQFTFCQLFIQQMCDFSTYIVIVSSIVFYFFIIIFFKRKESSHINDRMLSSFYGVEHAAIMKDIGLYISQIQTYKNLFSCANFFEIFHKHMNIKKANVFSSWYCWFMGTSYPRITITNIKKANSTFIVIKASVSYRTYTKYFINKILLSIKAYSALFCLNHPFSDITYHIDLYRIKIYQPIRYMLLSRLWEV